MATAQAVQTCKLDARTAAALCQPAPSPAPVASALTLLAICPPAGENAFAALSLHRLTMLEGCVCSWLLLLEKHMEWSQ